MPEVEFRNVRKVYPGGVVAIQSLDLKIGDGELLALLGPSGCGKSTLLRICAGLESITKGEVLIGDRVVNDLEPGERDIAMVFQNYALYPHMTVRANLAYGLKNRGTPKQEINERVVKAAHILQLDELLERRPRQLSGGQRQRVAMGRAIVREPQVFLFDEPLSNLDAKLRVHARLEIKKLQRSLNTTSLYVTHDQVEAMTLADRLVVMNAGVAEQIGQPMEVYSRPATVFVAGFIGSPAMNFLPGSIASQGQAVSVPGATLNLTAGGTPGQAITLGIRPEHLVPANDGGPVFTRLKIEHVEPLGADTLAHGHLGDSTTECTIRLPEITTVKSGDIMPVSAQPHNLHVFDAESGHRLSDVRVGNDA